MSESKETTDYGLRTTDRKTQKEIKKAVDGSLSTVVNRKVLYVSGEESEEQIKMRASRISSLTKNDNFYLISSTTQIKPLAQ